jgi:hypothetical protein
MAVEDQQRETKTTVLVWLEEEEGWGGPKRPNKPVDWLGRN